jgi:hypothetical protein
VLTTTPTAHFAPPPDTIPGRSVVLRAPHPAHPSAVQRRTAPYTAIVAAGGSVDALKETLLSLDQIDEILVLVESPDVATRSLVASFPQARLVIATEGDAMAAQTAVDTARHDWVLWLDQDQSLSEALAQEIAQLRPELHFVYSAQVQDYFQGRLITTCGWSRQKQACLFNRVVTGFAGSTGHLTVQSGHLRQFTLAHPLRRRRIDTLDEILVGSHLAARQACRTRPTAERTSAFAAAARGVGAFLRSYLWRSGCFQGRDGLILSVAQAQDAFWQHLYRGEAARLPKPSQPAQG